MYVCNAPLKYNSAPSSNQEAVNRNVSEPWILIGAQRKFHFSLIHLFIVRLICLGNSKQYVNLGSVNTSRLCKDIFNEGNSTSYHSTNNEGYTVYLAFCSRQYECYGYYALTPPSLNIFGLTFRLCLELLLHTSSRATLRCVSGLHRNVCSKIRV